MLIILIYRSKQGAVFRNPITQGSPVNTQQISGQVFYNNLRLLFSIVF